MKASTDSVAEASTVDPSRADRPAPYLLLVAVTVLMVGLRAGIGPIRDIDSYWHIRLGREILDGIAPGQAGRGWSFAPVPDTWVSTQWLAETLFAALDRLGGLQTLLVYRAVSTILVLATLYLVTVHRRPIRAGAWLFLVGGMAVGIYSQERSQQLTFILAPLVGWWVERTWREGRVPHWWIVLPLVIVWSNFHGGWVLLPMGLALAALARALDHGWRDPGVRHAVALAALVSLGAAVSPGGPANIVAALRFSGATALISEWLPIVFWDWTSLPLLLSLGIAAVSWARGRQRPSRGELVLVLSLLLFATVSWRNMTPAVLILAPVLTGTLARALGDADPRGPGERPRLVVTSALIAGAGVVMSISTALVQQPVIPADVPLSLLSRIEGAGPQRVLNNYNISGPLLYLGGDEIVVSIDGRADRNGAAYIERDRKMTAGEPGWQSLVEELRPTAALLRADTALPELMVAQRGWVEVGREGDWVLLRAPGSAWPGG